MYLIIIRLTALEHLTKQNQIETISKLEKTYGTHRANAYPVDRGLLKLGKYKDI